METLFITLLNMSITAGWLILAVILIRLVFRKMPKSVRCILWGLVAVRLICPVSIESRFSVIPDVRVLNDTTGAVTYTEFKDVYPAGDNGTISSAEITENIGFEKDNSLKYAVSKHIVSFVNTHIISSNNIMLMIQAAWVLGIATLIIYALINYVKLRKIIAEAVPLNDSEYPDNVMIADSVKSPFILGVFNPVIYIPSDTEQCDLRFIIEHEQAHIKRKDHIFLLLGFALLTVYCFNPLAWISYVLFCRDIELACDESVINGYDDSEKKSYSRTLLLCGMQKRIVFACPLAFGEIGVKERIKAVLNHKKAKVSIVAVSAIICAALTVCFLTNPVVSHAKGGNEATESETTYAKIDNADGSFYVVAENSTADEAKKYYEYVVKILDGDLYEVDIVEEPDGTLSRRGYNNIIKFSFSTAENTGAKTVNVEKVTYEEYFSKFADYGITYEVLSEKSRGNVYYNGELVNTFINIEPDGGVFTYMSIDNYLGKFNVQVKYDENGNVSGIEKVY